MESDALRPALFLDRDGVINIDRGYVYKRADFEFVPGIFELAGGAHLRGYALVVVTNQAGIGRGLYDEAAFLSLTEWMKNEFIKAGAPLTAVYYCPYHPEHGIGAYLQESFDRKPNPGMILRAAKDHSLDLSRSVFVGDRDSDMIAAERAEIPHRFLFTSECKVGRAGVTHIDALSVLTSRLEESFSI